MPPRSHRPFLANSFIKKELLGQRWVYCSRVEVPNPPPIRGKSNTPANPGNDLSLSGGMPSWISAA